MSNKYEDLIKNARMNADCGEHMSPAEVTTLLNVVETTLSALAAENAGLKSNLMYWDSEDAEPARSPLDIAHEASFGEGVEFDVQVAARMPSMTYRVVRRTTYSTEIELVRGGIPETPATDAFLAEVRAHDLNAFIRHHSAELDAHIKNGGEQLDEKSVRIRDIIVSARLFREQIRKEAAQ